MYQPYFDITEKLGKPLWWDENGVPRYVAFHPEHCADIYAKFSALIAIRCQGCGAVLPVAATWSMIGDIDGTVWDESGTIALPSSGLPKTGDAGFCGYGDAPWHGDKQCSGTTMSTGIVRIIEFWAKERCEWKRKPAHEVYVGEDDEFGRGEGAAE